MVLPGVAEFTRVCAYDRPGTYASIGEDDFVSRSDAIAQPRTAPEVVAELHALLQAAEIPGPYVLAATRWAASSRGSTPATYPDEVVGLVLVDAYSERLETLMPPGALGRPWCGSTRSWARTRSSRFRATAMWRRSATARTTRWCARRWRPHRCGRCPWPSSPMASRSPLPADAPGVHHRRVGSGTCCAANEDLATLVPNARFSVATESGHDIHQDQPELVIEAIRQVVAGVRNPDTWYDLTSCCAT